MADQMLNIGDDLAVFSHAASDQPTLLGRVVGVECRGVGEDGFFDGEHWGIPNSRGDSVTFIQTADVEHGQDGQDMIVAGQVVHVAAVDSVPLESILGQHRSFGSPGGAGGVDNQQGAGQVNVGL